MSNELEQPDTTVSWAVSVAFWLALLVAATAYAAVVISPKLINFVRLRHDFGTTQLRLVMLEHETSDLQEMVDSLERRDPVLQRKLAMFDFGAMRRGEELIAVDEDLQLSIHDNDPVFDLSQNALPWYGVLIEPFATNQTVRRSTLLAASGILIFAFMFLQESATIADSEMSSKNQSLAERTVHLDVAEIRQF
ncbi:MAG: hypothetical protein NT013_04725 [Planctomycetia bacterium]|nr:hypothetical protein [Planctomycetia bacterium]